MSLENELGGIMPHVKDHMRHELHTWVQYLADGVVPPGMEVKDPKERISNRQLRTVDGKEAPLVDDGSDTHVLCACNKRVSILQMKMRKSQAGAIYVDNVCEGCEKTYQDTCKIICPTCKRVRIRMTPAKDKIGFAFEKGKTYHFDGCPACTGKLESPVIEKLLYDRRIKLNKPTPIIQRNEPGT